MIGLQRRCYQASSEQELKIKSGTWLNYWSVRRDQSSICFGTQADGLHGLDTKFIGTDVKDLQTSRPGTANFLSVHPGFSHCDFPRK